MRTNKCQFKMDALANTLLLSGLDLWVGVLGVEPPWPKRQPSSPMKYKMCAGRVEVEPPLNPTVTTAHFTVI